MHRAAMTCLTYIDIDIDIDIDIELYYIELIQETVNVFMITCSCFEKV